MGNENLELVKAQFIAGQAPAGSILAKTLSGLSAEDVAKLRGKAAEGSLGLELQRMAMQNKFQASTVDMEDFIRNVQQMERTHTGVTSSYNMQGEFETASGKTVISSKKGCYIATAVYGSFEHPNVIRLRQFRDSKLEPYPLGRILCRLYYAVSPSLAKGAFSRNPIKGWMRRILDVLVGRI